jgi:hypothetical protein
MVTSIYTSLGHKIRVRLRVTCDFGLWRRRGEERSRHNALNRSGGDEVSTVIVPMENSVESRFEQRRLSRTSLANLSVSNGLVLDPFCNHFLHRFILDSACSRRCKSMVSSTFFFLQISSTIALHVNPANFPNSSNLQCSCLGCSTMALRTRISPMACTHASALHLVPYCSSEWPPRCSRS